MFLYTVIILLVLIQMGCTSKKTTTTEASDPTQYLVNMFTTTGSKTKLLEKQDDLVLTSDFTNELSTSITIDDNITYQEIDGFGAALTESSAYLIYNLPAEQRNQVIRDLFSNEGIGINFIRLPMGASDFALNNYSYDDVTGEDLTLSQFSIERDRAYVIPVLKAAFTYNNQIKLMGSPWSAPAWMKNNKSMNGGSLKDEYIDIYGDYFIKFIEAYKEEGLPIYAVTLQNEPLHETGSYPTMKMSANQQIKLIKNLGPKLAERNLDTKIIIYDHNWDNRTYAFTILNDNNANKYVAGTAFHCYAGSVDSQSKVHNAFPDKGIWFTECSGGQWATNFSENISWNMENIFIGSINNYSKSVLLWNIALDKDHGPKNGGCQDCRGVITIKPDGSVVRNEEYYMIGHFSKFVLPQALRIETKLQGNQNIINTAFRNPDGSIVLVIHNKGALAQDITLKYNGAATNVTILGKSTSTLIINKEE